MQINIYIENEFSNWLFILLFNIINKIKIEKSFFNKQSTVLLQTLAVSWSFPGRSLGLLACK